MLVLISEINIGERIREDMGDLKALAESIKERGLLHPIIIDENMNLIAGHRRLQAVEMLGWHGIETRVIHELSDKEKRLIELEENTKRKQLTEYEASKNLHEMVEVTKEILKEENELLAPSAKNPKGGRPKKNDSEEKVAERLGVPRKTINEAKHHVKAVEENPNLIHLPKKDAIKTSKEPEKLSELEKAYADFPDLKKVQASSKKIIYFAEQLRQLSKGEQADHLKSLVDQTEQHKENMKEINERYKKVEKVNEFISKALYMQEVLTDENMELWLSDTSRDIDWTLDILDSAKHEIETFINLLMDRKEGQFKLVSFNGKN